MAEIIRVPMAQSSAYAQHDNVSELFPSRDAFSTWPGNGTVAEVKGFLDGTYDDALVFRVAKATHFCTAQRIL